MIAASTKTFEIRIKLAYAKKTMYFMAEMFQECLQEKQLSKISKFQGAKCSI